MENCDKQPAQDATRVAMRVSKISIWANAALSVFKLFAGVVAHSGAMISDAVHSASDVFSTIVVMIGIRAAGRDSDDDHPYGHERLESVAAVLLAAVLILTGFGIGASGVQKIAAGVSGQLEAPGVLALVAAVVSVAVKEWMYWFTRKSAKAIRSDAMMADAWHHRSDALSSIGSFVGILGARMGFPILDPIASLVICVLILKVAVDILREAVGKLVDKACDEQTTEQMRALILSQQGVETLDDLKTRLFGAKIYADVAVGADASLSFEEAHAVAERVHEAMEAAYPDLKHCSVHVNPVSPDGVSEGTREVY